MDVENPILRGQPNDHYNKIDKPVGKCKMCGNVFYENDDFQVYLGEEYYCDYTCLGYKLTRDGDLKSNYGF